MPRFSLSRQDSCSTSDEDEGPLFEYSSDDDDESEEEPPHPLGFSSPGRYGLFQTAASLPKEYYQIKNGFQLGLSTDLISSPTLHQQQYPSLDYYHNAKTASTSKLIHVSKQLLMDREYEQADNMQQITKLLHDASFPGTIVSSVTVPTISYPKLDVSHIKREIEEEEAKYRRQHEKDRVTLQKIIDKAMQEAERRRKETEAQEEKERIEQEEIQREKLKKQQVQEEEERKKMENEQKSREREESKRKEKEEAALLETERVKAESDYIARAEKLMAQLVQVRSSVEPFEKNKAVTKRRLQMKKIVNGRVNTLSENVDKIRAVAQEVSSAIAKARDEDEALKQKISQGDQTVTSDVARGKRYLIDLLSSNVIVRAQAEGFNGQRGDGFPLASMLAMVSVENKELIPILAAHIYTVCPVAIPKLPSIKSSESEESFMENLGMQKGKNGEFETFERFLTRTEGIISLMGDIMSSEPENHILLGGHHGALKWLSRFLALLPDPPSSPLPLLTAPVLDAFLKRAGHMLANKHGEDFKSLLDKIVDDIVNRLDETPIGQPSATRLRKIVGIGFDGFRSMLPSRALPELYCGASRDRFTSSSFPAHLGMNTKTSTDSGSSTMTLSSPFGSSETATPFGNFRGKSTSDYMESGKPSSSSSPFGSSSSANPSFGNHASNNSVYDGPNKGFSSFSSSSTTMVSDTSGPSQFGSSQLMESQTHVNSPFSTLNAPNPSPFSTSAAPATFGSSTQNPFGGSTAPTASPFGSSTTQTLASPFGSQTGQNPTSFNSTSNSSPFGAPTQSPFGATAVPGPSPFGSSSTVAPFGGSSSSGHAFQVNSALSGSMTPSPSPFGSSSTAVPFGASATPFQGPTSNSSPFTSNGPSGSSTFPGASSAAPGNLPFGQRNAAQQQQSGISSSKQPCKFYAQGTCRYGESCRFSHDNPPEVAIGNSNTFGSSPFGSSPFGGPRR